MDLKRDLTTQSQTHVRLKLSERMENMSCANNLEKLVSLVKAVCNCVVVYSRYHGDHLAAHTNTTSSCCTPEVNIHYHVD